MGEVMGEVSGWAKNGRRRTTATPAPSRSPVVSVVPATPIEETLPAENWATCGGPVSTRWPGTPFLRLCRGVLAGARQPVNRPTISEMF
jgi:hypothetical protein